MKTWITPILCCLLLIAAGGGGRALLRAAGSIYAPLGKLETAMAEQFPAADRLRKLEVSLSYMGGQKEQA